MSNQIISISESVRPDTYVIWKVEGDGSQKDYFQRVYLDTGKALSREIKMTEEGLKRTITTVWASNEARLAYMQDPVIIADLQEQTNHRIASNITHTWTNQEISLTNEIVRTWSGEHLV